MLGNLLKSVLHNLGVVAVGFIMALMSGKFDSFLGLKPFSSYFTQIVGWVVLINGFLLRVWATYHFYKQRMKVVSLKPQNTLITTGPYRFSRNPLYLGGNVFVFFGASVLLGTTIGLLFTVLHLPLMDRMIRREEIQLEQRFGKEWVDYKKRVRRWI